MQARTSASGRSYSRMTSWTVHPDARKSRTRETQMRWPLIHGLPKHTLGSIEIRARSSSRFTFPPSACCHRTDGRIVNGLVGFGESRMGEAPRPDNLTVIVVVESCR